MIIKNRNRIICLILSFFIIFSNIQLFGTLSQYSNTPYDRWQMKAISFTQTVSNLTIGSPEVVVVIIDSGIDFKHEDLGEELKWENPVEISGLPYIDDDGNGYVDDYYGWDFVDDDNDPSPKAENLDINNNGIKDELVSHATGIAGIIAGQGQHILGIVPNIRIIDIKIFNSDGVAYDIVKAWKYVLSLSKSYNNIKVINFSATVGTGTYLSINKSINSLINEYDVSIVASSGNKYNSGYYNLSSPANHPDVISVGSIDEDYDISAFSQRGEGLDFVAPGENVFSLSIGNQINNNLDGTSFASPFITGAIAYLYSLPIENLNHKSVIDRIKNSTTDLGQNGYDNVFGYGLLNMTKLIKNINIQDKSVSYTNIIHYLPLLIVLVIVLRTGKKKNT